MSKPCLLNKKFLKELDKPDTLHKLYRGKWVAKTDKNGQVIKS